MSMFESRQPSELTMLLADDDILTRTGVRLALESANLRVVAEVATAHAAVSEALRLQPDVCLLAIHLPGGGIEATKQIRDALPKIKIVMLTGSERDEDLFGSLQAGADGYLWPAPRSTVFRTRSGGWSAARPHCRVR